MFERITILITLGVLIISCGTETPTETTTTYQITTSANPSEGGEITVSPEGNVHDEGTEVTLTPQPSEGYVFSEWSGDKSSADNPLTFTLNQDVSVTGVFMKKTYPLNISTEGEGTVTEAIVQEKDYEHGTTVQLTANPSEGWKFKEWSGDISQTENPTQIVVESETNVTAVFEKKSYPLSISIEGEGTVSKNPDQSEYKFGSTVELTANPSQNWEFVEWSGDTSSTDNPIDIVIDDETNITAIYESTVTNLNISIDWSDLGSVPEEVFSGEQSNLSSSSGTNKTVTDFGIRVEYLSSSDTLAKTVSNTGNQTANISFSDISPTDSIAVYALAVNTDDAGELGGYFAVKLGAIQNMVLEDSTNYELTSDDFEWFAPSWGTGPDFTESGWDTARVDKSLNRADVEFYAVNPFDKPYKTSANNDRLDFIMRLSGTGAIGDYQGNNIREYIYQVNHPNSGTQDTVEVQYPWAPYVHYSWFGFPKETYYFIDLRRKFIVIFE